MHSFGTSCPSTDLGVNGYIPNSHSCSLAAPWSATTLTRPTLFEFPLPQEEAFAKGGCLHLGPMPRHHAIFRAAADKVGGVHPSLLTGHASLMEKIPSVLWEADARANPAHRAHRPAAAGGVLLRVHGLRGSVARRDARVGWLGRRSWAVTPRRARRPAAAGGARPRRSGAPGPTSVAPAHGRVGRCHADAHPFSTAGIGLA